MTAHLHAELTEGCYRCELNKDEAAAIAKEIAAERASIARGICPRSNQPIMPGGSLRPSCSFCDCGDPEPIP